MNPRKAGTDPGASGVLLGLLVRIARKDDVAMERFYDLTRRRVFGLALRMLGDRGLAEEAALDVYSQVWRSAESYDPGRGSVWCWLLLLTRTRSLDLIRSRNRRADLFDELDEGFDVAVNGPGPDEATEATEEAQKVRAALDSLPPAQREALQVAYFRGLSYSETAVALGLPLGTLKTRIRTGLASLRTLLGGVKEEPS